MLKSVFTLLVIAVFAVFAMRSHFAAMLMYWWFGIFRPHEWMWWDIDSLRLPLLVSAIFLVPLVLRGKFPVLKDKISFLLILFLATSYYAAHVIGCVFPSPVSTASVMALVIVSMFSTALLAEIKHFVGFLLLVTLSLYFYSAKAGILSVLQAKSLYDAIIGGGGFSGTNAVALGTAMGFFFIVFLVQFFSLRSNGEVFNYLRGREYARKNLVRFLLVCLLGGVVFIVNTGSRGAALSLIVVIVLWILLHPNRVKMLVVSGVLSMTFISFVGVSDEYKDRLASAFQDQEELDNSAASRSHFWGVAVNMAKENPWGVGVGCFKSYYDSYDNSLGRFGFERSVHSSHFAVLAENGYLGMAVWVCIFWICYVRLWSYRRKYVANREAGSAGWFVFYFSNALICSITVFLLGGSFYEMPYNDFTWIIFALVIGLRQFESKISDQDLRSGVNRRP